MAKEGKDSEKSSSNMQEIKNDQDYHREINIDIDKEKEKEEREKNMIDSISQSNNFLTESFLYENKLLPNYKIDPRESIDLNSIHQTSIKPISNQQSINISYDPNYYSRRSDYNLMNESTVRFLAEIDLRCDDHLTNFKQDVQADRFCSECRVLCCDSCVIEFHNSHIQAAKTKIEEYFKSQKNELEDMKSKLNSAIKQKSVLSELQLTMDVHDKNIGTFFLKRRTVLENLKIKIESVINEENELCSKMRDNVHEFYRNECYRRMEKPLKEMEDLFNRLQYFLRDWEKFSKTEKAKALKNDQVSNFKKDASELSDITRKAIEVFKSKSVILEKNLEEILKAYNYNDKISNLEVLVNEISVKINESSIKVNRLNFDQLIAENIPSNKLDNSYNLFRDNSSEEIQNSFNNLNVQSNNALTQNQIIYKQENLINQFSNNNNNNDKINNQIYPGYHIDYNNSLNCSNNQSYDMIQSNNIPILDSNYINQINNGYPNLNNLNQLNNNILPIAIPKKVEKPYYIENNFNYELLIGIKPKSDEIIIYDPTEYGFTKIKINKSQFQDPTKAFTTFPDNSRYVNLGYSILLTGGYFNKVISNYSYLIVITKKDAHNSSAPYDVSILPYSNMLEARERHNIINLQDRNQVLVCSGFFNSSTEICNMNSSTWQKLPKMNDVRANGTISYINKRYVWVFGGFKINERQQGVYLNSCEMIDLNDINKGWSFYNFDNINVNVKLSAMGVINMSNDSIMICGGYDGTQYKKEVYKVSFIYPSNVPSMKIEKCDNLALPGNFIFLHNGYVRIGEFAYNFDLQMNVVVYSPNENNFRVK